MNCNFTKWLMLLLATFIGVESSAQTVIAELEEYFYPFTTFSYIVSPDLKKSNMVSTYSLSNSNGLIETREMWNGYSSKKIADNYYILTIDEDRQAVVSTHQLIQNIMGSRRASDKITMFLLPKDSESVNWTETVNGETSNCLAKFVYISFTLEGKRIYRKAVKIEKSTQLDKSSSVKEWSYWVKGLSRLATYGYWGDSKKVNCLEKSVNIRLDDPIHEISKTEYESKIK
ncbi:MAG: hypothetical protein K2H39_09050 [Paramuribaculum sp.]|nr:hypothetical protein [Paramuribaculum sp.]